jgi:hypothetical protein
MPVTSFTSGDPTSAGPPILYPWDGTTVAKTMNAGFLVGPNPVAPLGLPFSGDVLLPDGTVGTAYSVEESTVATGTVTPVTYSILSGSLPPGLSLSAVGNNWEISGTPTTAGTYSFTLRCSNSIGNTDVALSITIHAAASTSSVFAA